MNKVQIKLFQRTIGNFTPYISSLDNSQYLFIDTDVSGINDKNRNVLIINKFCTDHNDLIINLEGFNSFEGKDIKGKVFLVNGESKILIAEPVYSLKNIKSKFSIVDLKSYIQEVWLQTLNEYKESFNENNQSDKKLSKTMFFDKKYLVSGLISCAAIVLLSGSYFLGTTKNSYSVNSEKNQKYSINTGNEVDGKALALQNLGLDPNAMEFDNSCFTEN